MVIKLRAGYQGIVNKWWVSFNFVPPCQVQQQERVHTSSVQCNNIICDENLRVPIIHCLKKNIISPFFFFFRITLTANLKSIELKKKKVFYFFLRYCLCVNRCPRLYEGKSHNLEWLTKGEENGKYPRKYNQ